MRTRTGGPQGAKRPFTPTLGQDSSVDQIADAADHIARALSAIDHNVEAMALSVERLNANAAKLIELLGKQAR